MANRRQFISLGAASAFVSMLYPALKYSQDSKDSARLDFSQNKNNNYIQINMYGAPSRWNFDSIIDPFSEGHIKQTSVGTSFSDDLGNIQYKHHKHGDFYLPEIWNSKVAGNAVDKDLSQLLENMIFVRGVDPKSIGHPQSSVKTVRSNLSEQSLHGLNSNSSTSPLPALLMGNNPATRAFRGDKRGAIHLPLVSQNLFQEVFKIFHLKEMAPVEEVQKIIKSFSNIGPAYFKKMESSTELFFDNIDLFNDEYFRLLNKYSRLVERTLHDIPITGVNDFKMPGLSNKDFSKNSSPLNKYGRFKVDYQHIACGNDLRQMFKTANLGHLPHQFALTEFLITRGLTNSFLLTTPNEIGRLLYNVDNKNNAFMNSFSSGKLSRSNHSKIDISMDTHQTGSVINLYLTSMFYKGLGSCLIELVDSLKSNNLFDKTLIHLTSEFDRVPEFNLSGSAHNDRAQSSSFISGNIKETSVIGNIYLGDKEMGTIGTSAPILSLGRRINQDDMAETIAHLLDVPSPVRRSISLIRKKKSGWISTMPDAQNIEGLSF